MYLSIWYENLFLELERDRLLIMGMVSAWFSMLLILNFFFGGFTNLFVGFTCLFTVVEFGLVRINDVLKEKLVV